MAAAQSPSTSLRGSNFTTSYSSASDDGEWEEEALRAIMFPPVQTTSRAAHRTAVVAFSSPFDAAVAAVVGLPPPLRRR